MIFLSALIAPWLGLADPYQGSMIRRLRHIGTAGYPLGTDELGRDMLARLIYGGRLSLMVGISPVIFAFCIGTSLGLVAGYVGGWVNTAIMRTSTCSTPSLRCCSRSRSPARSGPASSTPSSATNRLRAADHPRRRKHHNRRPQLDFVEAARASGADPFTIMRMHILGNVLGPIFVYATALFRCR